MKTQPVVVLSEDIHANGKALLLDHVQLVLAPDTSEPTAARLLAEADALILRASTQITGEILRATKRLRIIARTGVGYNNVDIAAATQRGIPVTVVPGANENAVAEHAIAMILALSKQLFYMDAAVKTGNWGARFSPRQLEISGRTLGLIGCGRIGTLTARKATALGMRVIAYDPALQRSAPEMIAAGSMEEVFAQADYLSLHLPATPSTHHLINPGSLSQFKPGAYLINTSRGELIDDEALYKALQEGHLAGAALDVFANEPPSTNHPLFSLPNVILSPHVAGSTFEANERLAVGAAQAVLDVLQGRTPAHVVNPDALAANAGNTTQTQ